MLPDADGLSPLKKTEFDVFSILQCLPGAAKL
jgi:hypothetical protein